MRDRFGEFPTEFRHLMDIMRLKIMARKLFITKIQDFEGKVRILFSPKTNVEPQDIFRLQEERKGRIRLLPEGFEIDMRGFIWDKIYKEISRLFTCLNISDNFNRNV